VAGGAAGRCLVSPPPRSEARAHLCKLPFACGQGFAPTPHSPRPPWRLSGRAAGHGYAEAAAATSTVGSGAGAARAARRARGHSRRRGTETAARSAPRTPAATLAPPSRPESLRWQIWGLSGLIEGQPLVASPLPPRPPLPDRAGTPCRTHSSHSALWAVAPTRSRQAAPLPVRYSFGS